MTGWHAAPPGEKWEVNMCQFRCFSETVEMVRTSFAVRAVNVLLALWLEIVVPLLLPLLLQFTKKLFS